MLKKFVAPTIFLGIFITIGFFLQTNTNAQIPQSTLKYTALGDSRTSGQGVPSQQNWAVKYSQYINQDMHTVTSLVNLGVFGATSADLLNSIRTDQNFKNSIASANVITLEIGINDFFIAKTYYSYGFCGGADNLDCFRSMVPNFSSNFSAIITEIHNLNNRPTTQIRSANIDYYSAGIDESNGTFVQINPFLSQINDYIKNTSDSSGIKMADIHLAFNGVGGTEDPASKGYLLPDGIHLTDLGHTVFANKFRELGYTELDQNNDGDADLTDNCPSISNPTQANFNSESITLPNPIPYKDITNITGDSIGDDCDPDIDHDGLTNTQEQIYGTDPNNPDSDGDGIPDGAEKSCSTNPLNKQSTLMNPLGGSKMPDKDYDSLPDYCEAILGTNPNVADSDGDGLIDGAEVNWGGQTLWFRIPTRMAAETILKP